jgi:hypothetical protein
VGEHRCVPQEAVTIDPIPPKIEDFHGVDSATYGPEYRSHILEQYKLYVLMADEISKRRNGANAFFFSINTATISFLGLMKAQHNLGLLWSTVIGLAGVTLSLAWQRTIQSYRDLNTAKFTIVHEIEALLPLRPYDAEWSLVGRGVNDAKYKPVSHIEANVPWIFFGFYIVIIIAAFVS